MKNSRFCCSILFLSSLMLSSCKITQEDLWGPKFYHESFQEIGTSGANQGFILLGEKYSYSLNDKEGFLANFLTSSLSKKVYLKGCNIRVKSSNKVNFELKMVSLKIQTLSFQETKSLRKMGFKNSKSNLEPDKNTLYKVVNIEGRRHFLNSNNITNKVRPLILGKEFRSIIWEKNTKIEVVGKVFLTPFAIVADVLMTPIYLIGIIGMVTSE